jgi:O-antigen ligase
MSKPRRRSPDRRAKTADRLDRVSLYFVAVLLFSTPLFLLTSISEYGYGKSIYALVGISLLTILWSAAAWIRGAWTVRWPWITVPFLGFVVATLLSLLVATNGRVVVQSLVLVIFFVQLLLIIAQVVRTRRDVYLLLASLLFAGVLNGLYGLLQHLGVVPGPFGGTGLKEVISTLGNRNYLGGFLAYLLFPSSVLVLAFRRGWQRFLSATAIAFCFGIVLLVDQVATAVALAGTSVAFLVGIAIFRCYAPLRRHRGWVLLLLAMLAITFAVHAPSSPLNSVVGLSADEPGALTRFWQSHSGRTRQFDYWVAWEMFKDSPWVGIGLGHYKLRFLEYKAAFLATPRGEAYDFSIPPAAQAHSDYLQMLAELGLLGGMALLGFLATLAMTFWRRIRRNMEGERRLELLLLACGVLPLLIHALVSFPAHLPASSLVLVSLLGLIASRAYGDGAVWTLVLPRKAIPWVVIGLCSTAVVVSGLAVSDLYANVLMHEGIGQLQRGNHRLGEDLLQRSLRYDFAPRQTYYFLASAQLRQNRPEDAWENLERCLTRYVDEAVYLTYANLAANRGELEKAQAAVELLLGGNPPRDVEQQARYMEALVAFQAGEHDRAVLLLEALTEDHPSYETGLLALGDLYAMLGRPVGAQRVLERALVLIDRKLERARAKLSSSTSMNLTEYGQIRLEIDRLQQQRELAVTRLRDLP